jgi:CRP-like cAMP-binding protein
VWDDAAVEVERLRALPLFGELDHHDLSVVAGWVRELEVAPGEILVEQGGLPRDLIVLERGTVEVVRDDETLATLGPGDVVGEMGLLGQRRAVATVRARDAVRAIAIPSERLDELAEQMPELTERLRQTAADRARANES